MTNSILGVSWSIFIESLVWLVVQSIREGKEKSHSSSLTKGISYFHNSSFTKTSVSSTITGVVSRKRKKGKKRLTFGFNHVFFLILQSSITFQFFPSDSDQPILKILQILKRKEKEKGKLTLVVLSLILHHFTGVGFSQEEEEEENSYFISRSFVTDDFHVKDS